MDKNRKIVLSILVLLVLSAVLAIIDISLTMQEPGIESRKLVVPEMGPGIGVIRIYGPISMENPGGGPLDIRSGSDAILQRLSAFEKDNRIKAVLVRINSPGGTVAATQEIFNKLMKLRKKNIILVASMGELAASGGYYVASACNYILANHGTITGSIGVIAVSPNLKGLFDKLGIRMNVIKSGRYKDILSAYRDIRPEERQFIQQIIDSSYQKFLKDVSQGRNLPISDIEPYADGRVMNGESAVKYKLIDGTGSYEDALTKARELAKLPENCAVYDESRNPLERLLLGLQNIFKQDIAVERPFRTHLPLVEYRYMP